MSQNTKLSGEMVERRSFDEQMVGFVFSINELRSADSAQFPESDAAYAVHTRAYRLLDTSIRELAEWVVEDDVEPEIKYTPYELCEQCLEHDTSEDQIGFEFWLYSNRLLDDETIAAFRSEVRKRYEQAAAELGATCAYLYTKTSITEKVTISGRISDN